MTRPRYHRRVELEFVPIDEQFPEDGVALELDIADPDDEAELAAYREALERNPFAEDDVLDTLSPQLVDPPEQLIDADEYCIDDTQLTRVVGYPFAGQWAVTVTAATPRGVTRAELFRQIVRVYSAMYEHSTAEPLPGLYNMQVESPQFGTAWHRIEDLALDGICLQRRADGRRYGWVMISS